MREVAVAGQLGGGRMDAIVAGLASQAQATAEAGGLTPFHQRLIAEELTLAQTGAARIAPALTKASVDLNPHQIEAAAFALESLSRGGCMLADEVGLGKTVEAGIVIAQLAAEGRKRCIILCPAPLRAQWQQELLDKFGLHAICVDGFSAKNRGPANPFDHDGPVICSIQFGANRAVDLVRIPWDVVIIDEAHRLRNAWKPNNKTGKALRVALNGRPKLLLTATPLQNELMELYGLISLIDDSLLGPEAAFRSRFIAGSGAGAPGQEEQNTAAMSELKARIAPVVQRTLRRQVREYVKYTNRRSIVEDFTPSPDEQELYERVSDYLKRAELLAIEPGRRTLLTLIYRKLLASSTYAIAPTLRKLADGLEQRIKAAKAGRDFILSLNDTVDISDFSEEAEELTDPTDDAPKKQVPLDALEGELHELKHYADLAERIKVNAKGEALANALDRAFAVAAGYKWPQKAVIFTESKRTQEYLSNLLASRGYAGKISLLSGDGGGPEERRQLVIDFREKTQILISTEAGAEGLNLQFCNLLVNYDLPWNPQRVEQRIGRCHRYGQTRDVLVINFLNRSNAADSRLFELLEKKLSLFDGVFGASDEILGALESGVDFERRVLGIYQSCRTEEEVNVAFAALRADMEGKIGARMVQARELLLERFDGDVRARLRLAASNTKAALERRKQGEKALVKAVLGSEDASAEHLDEAAREVKGKPAPAISYVSLNASELPARMASLAGREGWWFVYRFELGGVTPPHRLVHVVLLREANGYRALPVADGDAIARLSGRDAAGRAPSIHPISAAQEAALNAAIAEVTAQAQESVNFDADRSREKAMQYCEDCVLAAREAVVRARTAWENARRELVAIEDPALRGRARSALEKADKEYRKRMSALRDEEERRYGELDRALFAINAKSKVTTNRTLIATAYFWLD